MFSQVSVCPKEGVYPSMQWARGVPKHAMGKGGVCPEGCPPKPVCLPKGQCLSKGMYMPPGPRGRQPPDQEADTPLTQRQTPLKR